jgi:hypothetical protein
MSKTFWLVDPQQYRPLLARLELTESEYLAAITAVTNLFPIDAAEQQYRRTLCERGSVDHFSLIPTPNRRLEYHPVPVLMCSQSTHTLAQLARLGRDLSATNSVIPDKTRNDLTLLSNYRGSLFEIEVAAELVRAGVTPRYSPESPDFLILESSTGIEVTVREVPIARAIAEILTMELAMLDFKELSVALTLADAE